jgi:phthiodiolone/phenolphthiodiolone dimycocerosates ketoreductase
MQRIEQQGWNFIDIPDQLAPATPPGLIPSRINPPGDDEAVISTISEVFLGSFELQTAASLVTSDIDIHMGVVDMLRRTPSVFAQELVTIDHISKGRATWCVGTGEAKQFEPYGEPRSKPIARTVEAVRFMHALWESAGGAPVTRESEFWPLQNALFPIPLYEGKKPSILMVGGGQQILELAGELCDGWMTLIPGGALDDASDLANKIDEIKRIAVKHGRDPNKLKFSALASVVLAETDEVAWQYARHPAAAYPVIVSTTMQSGATWKELGYENPLGDWVWPKDTVRMLALSPDLLRDVAKNVPEEMTSRGLIWGGPERVANRLQKFVDAGLNHISFFNFVPWCDPSAGSTWAELASDVMVRLGHPGLSVS